MLLPGRLVRLTGHPRWRRRAARLEASAAIHGERDGGEDGASECLGSRSRPDHAGQIMAGAPHDGCQQTATTLATVNRPPTTRSAKVIHARRPSR